MTAGAAVLLFVVGVLSLFGIDAELQKEADRADD